MSDEDKKLFVEAKYERNRTSFDTSTRKIVEYGPRGDKINTAHDGSIFGDPGKYISIADDRAKALAKTQEAAECVASGSLSVVETTATGPNAMARARAAAEAMPQGQFQLNDRYLIKCKDISASRPAPQAQPPEPTPK